MLSRDVSVCLIPSVSFSYLIVTSADSENAEELASLLSGR